MKNPIYLCLDDSGGASLQYISVTGDGVTPVAVESADKLAATWGSLKK